MSGDSRVDAVVAKFVRPSESIEQAESSYRAHAAKLIRQLESAGLLVLDPNSPELVERLHQLLMLWFDTDDEEPRNHAEYLAENITQDILTVLGEKPSAHAPDLPPATPTGGITGFPAGGTPLPSGTPLTDPTPGGAE